MATSPMRTSTPISNKMSGSQPYASSDLKQDSETRFRLAEETKGRFLGPMPYQMFLDKFLPRAPNASPCPPATGVFRHVPFKKFEADMVPPFISAVRPFAPSLSFVNSSNNPDPACGLKPDISVYGLTPGGHPFTDFSRMKMWLEFKVRKDKDCFLDPTDRWGPNQSDFPFEKDSIDGRKSRGQIASYAAAHMGSQFRVHSFSVSICGHFARFIRWDRAGAIVSQGFDYTEQPTFLADFFWRFNHLDPRSRGDDTSISTPSANELFLVQGLLVDTDVRRDLKKFIVNRGDNRGYYVARSPEYASRSPFGRATRPFQAYDLGSRKIVFLKDYWRIDGPGMEKEGDIYEELKKHRVPHIAPFDRGDDVLDHRTVTQDLRGEPWAYPTKEMSCHKHYRLTLNLVGREITNFNSSWEFVNAIADAMEAHQAAFDRAGILHRDISAGNIIIGNNGEGILIDWDLSVNTRCLHPHPRGPERTGTWQFISAALLSNKNQMHGLLDDQESALHLLTWIALRYTNHNLGHYDLKSFMDMFDETFISGQGVSGGRLKEHAITSKRIKCVEFTGRPQLDALLLELTEVFAPRYMEVPDEALRILQENILKTTADLSDEMFKKMFPFQWQKHRLANPAWLVETIRRHLQGPGAWPSADKPVTPSGNKQKSDKRNSHQAGLDMDVSRTGRGI